MELLSQANEDIKHKCSIAALELVLADENIAENEIDMINDMQEVVGIDDSMAKKIFEVVTMKYTT